MTTLPIQLDRASLALPSRDDVPVRLAFFRFALDVVDQRKQVVNIDAVDDRLFGSLR
jgi:hypothetical protein